MRYKICYYILIAWFFDEYQFSYYRWRSGSRTGVWSGATRRARREGKAAGGTEKRTSLRSLPFETGALSPLLKCVLPSGIILFSIYAWLSWRILTTGIVYIVHFELYWNHCDVQRCLANESKAQQIQLSDDDQDDFEVELKEEEEGGKMNPKLIWELNNGCFFSVLSKKGTINNSCICRESVYCTYTWCIWGISWTTY